MSRFTDWTFRLRALFGRGSLERQVDREFAFHVSMQAEQLVRDGWSAEAAEAEARRRFGSETRARERARDSWGVGVGYELAADMRHALRQMRRRPGFSVLAIATLGLGIGATTALFAVVYGLLVRPLPFRDEGLSVFWSAHNWRGSEYDHVREGSLAFENIAAYSSLAEPLRTGPADASRLLEYTVSTANLFDVLDVKPMLGRGFAPGEDRAGAERVVVISNGLWQEEFGGAEDVIGRRVTIGGHATTIIGVMPRGFYFPSPEFRAWRPLILDPNDPVYAGSGWLALIGAHKKDVGEAEMTQELARLTRLLGERFTYTAAWDKTKNASMTPVREYLLGSVRNPLLLLMGAVALLLVIACANAAALILARTTDRTTELSVRVALGANHSRIARQIVTESVVMATIAAIIGALVAATGFQTLVASLPVQRGFGGTVSLGWQAFATAFALALAVGLAVAIAPVRQVLRGRLDVRERSEEGLRRGTRRVHAGLIVAQVTLAVMLVSGATLLIRSVERIRSIDTGFDASGVVTLDLVREAGEGGNDPFYAMVLERVGALPGVASAGFTNRLPVRDGGWQGSVNIEGRTDLGGAQRPSTLYRSATPDYLATLGIQVRAGRGIEGTDRADGALVALVSESFARRIWPDENPIGKRVSFGGTQAPWRTIVGVVEETRMTSIMGENPLTLIVPHVQMPWGLNGGAVLVVRGTTNPASLITAIRSVVAEIDGTVAIARTGTMESVINTALSEPLQLRFFLGLFAGLALILGAVGVYGVVSYAVMRRRAEFGIRMALGAAPGRVLALVVRTGMLPVLLGAVVGVVASIGLSRAVRGFLYEISPTDALSLMAAASTVLLAGVVAAVVPAWRAGSVSPVEALRSD
ncbi:MAG TPA: ABC transporter permease [Gemmatimonadaceae bacterium]|nr:ABC transporter permease [Gemmatimonadaceae bacterium]